MCNVFGTSVIVFDVTCSVVSECLVECDYMSEVCEVCVLMKVMFALFCSI